MKTAIKRVLLVSLAHLIGSELLSQLAVHWRESTGELCFLGLYLATAIALIWAILPAVGQLTASRTRMVRATLAVVVLLTGVRLLLGIGMLDYVFAAIALGLVWAMSAARDQQTAQLRRRAAATVTVLGLFLVIFTVDGVYSWHVRPNLRLYQEPGWVAQHPSYQRQLRQRIERNTWRHADKPTSPLRP